MTVFKPPYSPSRAVFLGAGIHCSLGFGVEQCLQTLRLPLAPPALYPATLAGETLVIPYQLLTGMQWSNIEQQLYEHIICVAQQAIVEAGLTRQQTQRLGLFVGSSSFDVTVSEAQLEGELALSDRAIALRNPSFSRLADFLVERMQIRGPDFSVNTACTASANALVSAVDHVEMGLIDHALVISIELYNNITALGFHGLGLLAQSVMKPFDRARDGLVLGEGVSALVVGCDPQDGKRRFFLRGSASLCDTHSISAAAPDGSTIKLVMEKALRNAGLAPDAIAAIKVHGTASLSNDEAEAAGMHQVFNPLPPMCALKPYLGHTLGACGLNELILFYRALEADFLVATPGIGVEPGDLNVCLNQKPVSMPPGHFMLNYFGFGGNNCSIIISNKAFGNKDDGEVAS